MIQQAREFESVAMTYLNAAYNLARWLVRDEHVAQDMVQEAYLRALKYRESFRGGDMRPWLLSIVRNTCYTWLEQHRQREDDVEFDEDRDSGNCEMIFEQTESNPEALVMRKQESMRLNQSINALPSTFREVLILRELEELSYEDIAVVVAIPVGTVMSRLSRARAMLRVALKHQVSREVV
ncbi:MAG: sigma-70 family RNA polymerase sigma factor [Rhodocyclales bacterium]|nr:sigma-70 family RNA polymerase sigma factor [Rhodocyclales bacterium]